VKGQHLQAQVYAPPNGTYRPNTTDDLGSTYTVRLLSVRNDCAE